MTSKYSKFLKKAFNCSLPSLSFAFSPTATTSVDIIDKASSKGYDILLAVAGFGIAAGFVVGAWMLFMSPGQGMMKIIFQLMGGCILLALGCFAVPQFFNFCV